MAGKEGRGGGAKEEGGGVALTWNINIMSAKDIGGLIMNEDIGESP